MATAGLPILPVYSYIVVPIPPNGTFATFPYLFVPLVIVLVAIIVALRKIAGDQFSTGQIIGLCVAAAALAVTVHLALNNMYGAAALIVVFASAAIAMRR